MLNSVDGLTALSCNACLVQSVIIKLVDIDVIMETISAVTVTWANVAMIFLANIRRV